MDRGPFGAGHRHSVYLQRAEGVTGADLGMTGPECDNDMNHHHARRPLPTVGRSSPKNLTDPGVGFLLNHVLQPVAFDAHIKSGLVSAGPRARPSPAVLV